MDLANAMLAAGGLTAVIGLVPLAGSVQRVTNRRILGVMAYAAATLAIGGAAPWVIISYIQIARSPFDVAFRDISPWLWGIYGFLTQTAIIILRGVLLPSHPKWLGWMLLVSGAIMYAALLALGDLPPGDYYVVFLILGAALLTSAPTPAAGIVGNNV